MKLFDTFEAVKFPEENLIFITHNGYLYYIYSPKHNFWRRHRNAGNDHITVSNYPDVSREELERAMKGIFPQDETDFLRLCVPSRLRVWDLLSLLKKDYNSYMSDADFYCVVEHFLLKSDVCHKSYEKLRDLLDEALIERKTYSQVFREIKELSLHIIGRDIFKKEIGIVDGHDGSSYFWIMPVRIIDDSNTNALDNVAQMRSAEISIEENDIAQYLTPFLYKYFDTELEANRKRVEDYWIDDEGNEQVTFMSGFEWYLTHNFFTFDSVTAILKDISHTINALSRGEENEFTEKLRSKRGTATHELIYAKKLCQEQIDEYNANRPQTDDTELELIIDFYHRFIYRMEYMMKVGKEKGYNLISFMGP